MGNNILTKELLLKSVQEWNAARKANPALKPNLSDANLSGIELRGVNLNWVDLRSANLTEANLRGAKLNGADLSDATLSGADFSNAVLSGAVLRRAELDSAILRWADLSNADLSNADLRRANLSNANLSNANLSYAFLGWVNFINTNFANATLNEITIRYTVFSDVDLSQTKGLETVNHDGPSTIGIDTIYKSNGNIPEVFLRGCGVPDNFIEYARSLTAKAFDYYSCFISHSTADKDFADRLYADLQAKGVRCWYAPHDMEGGEHIDTQIDRAIKVHEKLLLVLSESSINSNWVKREITKAVKREEAEGKRVLFPISLVDFSTIEAWEFVDSKGRDLAEEIRKFYIPSFKGWENDNSLYTTEFDKLLKAFKDKSKQ